MNARADCLGFGASGSIMRMSRRGCGGAGGGGVVVCRREGNASKSNAEIGWWSSGRGSGPYKSESSLTDV
jgi:hypothetical protein